MFNFGKNASASALDRPDPSTTTGSGYFTRQTKAGALETESFSTQGRSSNSLVQINTMPNSTVVDNNNSISSAINLGTISGVYQTTGSVSDTDRFDYYRFYMDTGSLNATLAGMSSDANLRIIRDANFNNVLDIGDEITKSVRTGTANESITLDGLGIGTYFLEVSKVGSGTTNFNLNLNVREGMKDWESEPNNSLAAPDFMDGGGVINLNGQRFYHGYVTSVTDGADYWRLKVNTASSFYTVLNGLASDADLQLLANDGAILATSSKSGTTADTITVDRLDAGYYYLKVSKFGAGSTPYDLIPFASPLVRANLDVTVRRVQALDDLEGPGRGEADFEITISLDNVGRVTSDSYEDDNDISPNFGLSRRVDINKRFIPFRLSVSESDGFPDSDEIVDINPLTASRTLSASSSMQFGGGVIGPSIDDTELHLEYDTLTGQILGLPFTAREGQPITVEGNGDADGGFGGDARITFEVNYNSYYV